MEKATLQRIVNGARYFLSGSVVVYFHNSVRSGALLPSLKIMYGFIERGNFLMGRTKPEDYRDFGNLEEFNVS